MLTKNNGECSFMMSKKKNPECRNNDVKRVG